MTWRELKNFINKTARKRKDFLDTEVNLYDFESGDEHKVDITELLLGDDDIEDKNSDNSNWIPYLSINDKKGLENETETKETSVD